VKRSEERGGAPVWDLPVRLLHWLLVLLIPLSWWSAKNNADTVHFWSGYTLLFLLIFRILWGFAGSSTARFASFVRGPSSVIAYIRGEQSRQPGHTPLGGLSVIAMLLSILVQLTSGLIQIDDDDFVEGPLSGLVPYDTALLAHDVHEFNFNILLTLIGLHLLAIAYYELVARRSIVWPMVSGRAKLPEGAPPMTSATTRRFIICAIAALLLVASILAGAPALTSG
jgi:cytochrome b